MAADGTRLKSAMKARLAKQHFDFFITLATNSPEYSTQRAVKALKDWDARVNRYLVGPKWRKRPDERTVWWAFSESLGYNPHWHLLLEIDPAHWDEPKKSARASAFPEKARSIWREIVPSGTSDVQGYRTVGASNYAAKRILREENWANFKSHLEFIR